VSTKKSCSVMLVAYAIAAIFVGHLIYRRFPQAGEVFFGGAIGGGLLWFGFTWLWGAWDDVVETLRLRKMMDGAPPVDDAQIAVAGKIEPISSPVASPFTGRPCAAVKYEVHNGGTVLYDGFALAPSVIFTLKGQIGILAVPDLQVTPRDVPAAEAVPNFSEYVARTEFLETARAARTIKDDGSFRADTRMMHGDVPLDHATFTEWSLAPGDEVFATGHYSAECGGLVPDWAVPTPVLRDAPRGFAAANFGRAIGSVVVAAIFVAVAAAGLFALYVFVPLATSEEMSPDRWRTWREVRLDRLLDRRVRAPMRRAGYLAADSVAAELDDGTARGRVTTIGHDGAVSRATASHFGDVTVIRIDDDAVALTVDRYGHPLRLRFGNDDVAASTFDRDLDLEFTESSQSDVTGRMTYFRDDAKTPACHVTFHALVQ